MKYRKLRIAWSVVFGVVCLLITLLWIRSYWRGYSIDGVFANKVWSFDSLNGNLGFLIGDVPAKRPLGWSFSSSAIHNKRAIPYNLQDARPQVRALCVGWKSTTAFFVVFPHLVAGLFAAVFAILPWMPWQFRRRTVVP